MSQPVIPVQAITLPSWTDPTAVAMYLTTFASTIVAVIAIFHPGFNPDSTTVQAVIGAASLIVAGGAQIYNAIRNTSGIKAAAAAGIPVAVKLSKAKPIVQPQQVPSLGNVTATGSAATGGAAG